MIQCFSSLGEQHWILRRHSWRVLEVMVAASNLLDPKN